MRPLSVVAGRPSTGAPGRSQTVGPIAPGSGREALSVGAVSPKTSSLRFKVTHADPRVTATEREKLLTDPGFGRIFTEHMVRIRWTVADGWHDAELIPHAPVTLDPGTSVLHYAQAVFEGLKAFRQAAGGVAAFRA